jgi:two-component system, OmpR family, response regulator MprA
MREAPRVLLVGDDARSAVVLRRTLEGEGFRVVLAADATSDHDLVLLEVEHDGVELARRMRDQTCRPILMLSSRANIEDRVAGLEAGADDYLAKPFARQELLARVRALLRGRSLAVESTHGRGGRLTYADLEVDLDTREVTRGGRPLKLRHLAFELLAYLLRHPERVLGRQELLEHVWGYPFDGEANVVEVTISRLRQALEAGGETRLIQTVRPIGYMLRTRQS